MSSVVRANASGGNLVTVGSLSNVIRISIFGAPGVQSAVALMGGTIAVGSAGSEKDATKTLALRSLGLTRDDVTITAIGTRRLEAICNGEVSASLIGQPFRSPAIKLGLPALPDLYAQRTPWFFSGLVVHRKYLKRHREPVPSFIRATVEGNYPAVSTRLRSTPVLARALALCDDDLIEKSYARGAAETPLNTEMSREEAQNVIDVVAIGYAVHAVDDYIDESLKRSCRL